MTEVMKFFPDSPIIEARVGERNIKIKNHFSLNLSIRFIEESEKTKDFRNAFIESVYDMYTKTEATDQEVKIDKISESDFSRIEESQLALLLDAILNKDTSTCELYRKIDCEDPYERFHHALNKQFQQSFQMIGQTIQKSIDGFKSISVPLQMYTIDHLISPIDQLISPIDRLISPLITKTDALQMVFPNVDSYMEMQLQELNKTTLEVSSIQFNEKWKQNFAFKESIIKTSSALNDQLTDVMSKFDFMSKELSSIITTSLQPTFDFLAQINTGVDHTNKYFKDRHDTLKMFGWWYLSGFDDDLFDEIFVNKDNLTKEDVDQLICNYYRENRCKKLKEMIVIWNDLQYFKVRKIDIHQVRVMHGQRYYNSSVTLLTILIEGVVRDFIKSQTGQGYYRFSQVRKKLRTGVDGSDEISLLEFRVANHVLESIEEIFGGNFDPANPQMTPDHKRNKRLHGQALEEQNEANSLKLFLQLNELFNLFSTIENQSEEFSEVLV